MNRLFSLLLFIALLPLSLLIAFLIFINGFKSVIFKQERIGFLKNTFVVYKFKTMENNQITWIGKFLRKLGLDEIPQLINIIKGEMNFVGPRPLTQYDIDRLEWSSPEFEKRWSVKPGITGLAQLGNTCSKEISIKNDFDYIDNQTFVLDFKIIIKTALVPIIGKLTK